VTTDCIRKVNKHPVVNFVRCTRALELFLESLPPVTLFCGRCITITAIRSFTLLFITFPTKVARRSRYHHQRLTWLSSSSSSSSGKHGIYFSLPPRRLKNRFAHVCYVVTHTGRKSCRSDDWFSKSVFRVWIQAESEIRLMWDGVSLDSVSFL
jgi:hypothetical protein